MAGGVNAAAVMCRQCLSRADRIGEGIEDDLYQCSSCGTRFGIDWSRGQPATPCWPPTPDEMEQARQIRAMMTGSSGGGAA